MYGKTVPKICFKFVHDLVYGEEKCNLVGYFNERKKFFPHVLITLLIMLSIFMHFINALSYLSTRRNKRM